MRLAGLITRFPSPLRSLAYRAGRGEGAFGAVLDALRFRPAQHDAPALPSLGHQPVRFAIGPANSAGQGKQWARALERRVDGVVATSFSGFGGGAFGQDVDVRIPVAIHRNGGRWHAEFERWLLTQTHVIWESGRPLLGRRHGVDVRREVEFFQSRGIACGLLFHGSDIRAPRAHAEIEPLSPFVRHPAATDALVFDAKRNARLMAHVDAPVFVSTPDLLRWVPSATWCPVVVDQAAIDAAPARFVRNRRPVVVHAPSAAWLKGSDLVEPVLRGLHDEGVIEYRRLEATVHSDVISAYASADVMLDQFALGIYGVAACEAMAVGTLVMSHVDVFTRSTTERLTGLKLPIIESTPDSLEAQLRLFAESPSEYDELRDAGRHFVQSVHNGSLSATALSGFLGVNS